MAEREKKPKITTGKVTVKKRSFKERFFSNLIEEDAGSLSDYIIDQLLIPTIKSTIVNIITGSAQKIFGEGSAPAKNKPPGTYINYNSMSKPTAASSTSSKYSFDNLIFENRSDAEDVKDQIMALIEGQYKVATVADLYDLVGRPTQFTDNNYGWMDLKNITVTYKDGGYKINLPKPVPLR